MILFLAKYPETQEDLKDGMIQRIMHMDNFFSSKKRMYLDVSYSLKKKKKKRIINEDLEVTECGFFHFYTIFKIFLKADFVFIHSVFNVLPVFFFILFFNKKYCIDLHGVVPEETLMLNGDKAKLKFKLFNLCERLLFRKASYAICVTNAMRQHYTKKFPNSEVNFLIYSIMPNNILGDESVVLNATDEDSIVNVVYSGNTQAWQNIDLMCSSIKKNLYDSYKFYILTGNPAEMKSTFKEKGLYPHPKIEILSLSPNELKTYYIKAHYGFILRDDVVVNKVACPTKMIEYLNYGIVPVVLSPSVGDFNEMGYEHIKLTDFNKENKPVKSLKNIEIIKELKARNYKVDIRSILNG